MHDSPSVLTEVQARLRSIESQIDYEASQIAAHEKAIEASNLKICELRYLRYEWGLVRDNMTPLAWEVNEAREAVASGNANPRQEAIVRTYGQADS